MSEAEEQVEERAGEIAVLPQELANRRLDGGVTEGNTVLAPADWQMLAAIAETVHKTEFVPVGLRGNAPKVLACMLYGNSLGIHPMIALKEIAVIDGTPSMSSALMVAKVMERGHRVWREEMWEGEGDERVMVGVTAHGARVDNGLEDSFSFTIAMARRAGLMGKKNWQNYPEAMLWWRSSSQLCSFLFPDVFMGSPYMPEELGADSPPLAETLGAGGAERPQEPEEPEAAEGQGEPAGGAEAPADGPMAVVSNVTDDPEADVDEEGDFWTPLDERDPTRAEYELALAVLEGDAGEEAVAAAQVLVETYEAAHAPVEAQSVVKPGTVAELMIQVNEAAERGDVEWLEGLLASEKAATRPRIRLVAGIDAVLEQAREAAQRTPFAAIEEQEEVEAGTPTDEERERLGDPDMQVKHAFDPSIPLDELNHTQLVVRVRAISGYMTDAHPESKEWWYEGLVTSASKIWKEVASLEELDDWQLTEIIKAAPEEATKVVGLMTGEQVEKLAATVGGSNPA